jgi:hypothetical protein
LVLVVCLDLEEKRVSKDQLVSLVMTVKKVNVVCLDFQERREQRVNKVCPLLGPLDLKETLVLLEERENEENLEREVLMDFKEIQVILATKEIKVNLGK